MNKTSKIIKYLDISSWVANNYIDIKSGVIFKDEETGEIFLQLKLKNLLQDELDNVAIKLICFHKDESTNSYNYTFGDYVFSDIEVDANGFFGADIAISLGFEMPYEVKTVIFTSDCKDGKSYYFVANLIGIAENVISEIQNREKELVLKKENSAMFKLKAFFKNKVSQEDFIINMKKLVRVSAFSVAGLIVVSFLGFYILKEYNYSQGLKSYNNRDYEKALTIFESLGDYKDSLNKSKSASEFISVINKKKIFEGTIGVGNNNLLGVTDKGNVLVYGGDDYTGKLDVQLWSNIDSVANGIYYNVGLRYDGTLVGAGLNISGQMNFDDWTNIKRVVSGGHHTVGLDNDGKVYATGSNTLGQTDVSSWSDIVNIAAGISHTVGLKSDGTVVATGSNLYGQCDVSDWTDIIKVVAGTYYTAGLKSDGTILVSGLNSYYQHNAKDWSNIIDISAGSNHLFGVTYDGRVISSSSFGSYSDFSSDDWSDIIMIFAGYNNIAAIKSDGSIISAGPYVYDGYLDKIGWTNIGRKIK